MKERFTPEQKSQLTEKRALSDFDKTKEGATYDKEGRLELTEEQVEAARKQMEADKGRELSPQELEDLTKEQEELNKEVQDLMVKRSELNKELLPVWNEMRELVDKLPEGIKKAIAEINGKYYFGGPQGELGALKDKRGLLETSDQISPLPPEAKKYMELINDTRLDEYINLGVEQQRAKRRLEVVEKKTFYGKNIE